MGIIARGRASGQRLVVLSAVVVCSPAGMADPTEPYNPLDLRRLGEGIARALLDHPVYPLPPVTRFPGSGIYAIYYTGGFAPYEPIALKNRDGKFEHPMYVGKGIPEGRRMGGEGFAATAGAELYARFRQHARTIQATENLKLGDFSCRYLVVAPVWIPLGEELLIRWFRPLLWNTIVTGFGNNDPGKGRYDQQRSLWDVLHPGRVWAVRCADNPRSPEQVARLVEEALERLGSEQDN